MKKYYGSVQEEVDIFKKDFEVNREGAGNVFFYYFEPKHKIKRPLAHEIGEKYVDKILIFVSPSFSFDFLSLTGRNAFKGISALEVLQRGIGSLKNAKVGGHPRGCGGIIQLKDFLKFKQNILKA